MNILRLIMLEASSAGSTLWRQNTGQGWTGDATRINAARTVTLHPGDVVIRNARPLHAGLCVGSSDLIGFTPVEITPLHVGQTIAAFTAVEVKAPKGRATTQQINFIDHVRAAGGLAGIARSPEDALKIIKDHGYPP